MKGLKIVFVLSASLLLTTCGIYEYYFLPQVPHVQRPINVATADLPNITTYNASGYTIFYRIYLSNSPEDLGDLIVNSNNRNLINPLLEADYSYFSNYTDPAKTFITTSSTFVSRSYFELQISPYNDPTTPVLNVLPATGGNLSINFGQGDQVFLTLNGGVEHTLSRSDQNKLHNILPDYFFRLREEMKQNSSISLNIDVVNQTLSVPLHHAYAMMFIVAVGTHPEEFNRIFSKPTLLNIFKLPS